MNSAMSCEMPICWTQEHTSNLGHILPLSTETRHPFLALVDVMYGLLTNNGPVSLRYHLHGLDDPSDNFRLRFLLVQVFEFDFGFDAAVQHLPGLAVHPVQIASASGELFGCSCRTNSISIAGEDFRYGLSDFR